MKDKLYIVWRFIICSPILLWNWLTKEDEAYSGDSWDTDN